MEGHEAKRPEIRQSRTAEAQKSFENIGSFLLMLDEYKPTIPEAVSQYYLEKSGVTVEDQRIAKFVSLAADQFLSEIIHDATQLGKLQKQGAKTKRKQDTLEMLELADVEGSLAKRNIYLRRRKSEGVQLAAQSSQDDK